MPVIIHAKDNQCFLTFVSHVSLFGDVIQVNMFCVLHTVAALSCAIVAKFFLRDEPSIVSLKATFFTRTVLVVCLKHLVIFIFVFDIL